MTANQTRKNKNSENAKETGVAAASRVSEERNTTDKPDKNLSKILDEAERRIQQRTSQKQTILPERHDNSFPDEPIDIYPEIKRKTVNQEPGDNPDISLEKTYQQLEDRIIEMYNPLHSISGFARMILDDNICDTAAQKEFVQTILQQSESLKLQLYNMHRSLKANSE